MHSCAEFMCEYMHSCAEFVCEYVHSCAEFQMNLVWVHAQLCWVPNERCLSTCTIVLSLCVSTCTVVLNSKWTLCEYMHSCAKFQMNLVWVHAQLCWVHVWIHVQLCWVPNEPCVSTCTVVLSSKWTLFEYMHSCAEFQMNLVWVHAQLCWVHVWVHAQLCWVHVWVRAQLCWVPNEPCVSTCIIVLSSKWTLFEYMHICAEFQMNFMCEYTHIYGDIVHFLL
jgi:hypothetical protein